MRYLFVFVLLLSPLFAVSNINESTVHFVGGRGTKAGDADSAGGCTLASFTGDLSDYMGTNGEPLHNNAGCTIDIDGADVRLTKSSGFATGLTGVLVNVDFNITYTDGVYEITGSTANSITIDLTHSSDVPTAEVWVGGSYTGIQAALDDDSTDVSTTTERIICTNLNETLSASVTPESGVSGSGKWLSIIGFKTVVFPSNDTAQPFVHDIISDMDELSLTDGRISTSYYAGAIEALRIDESMTRSRSDGTWVNWDASDGAFDVITLPGGGANRIRNIYLHNTDQASGNDIIGVGGVCKDVEFTNCRFDDAFNVAGGSSLSALFMVDTYVGKSWGDNADMPRGTYGLFEGCVFNGNGETVAFIPPLGAHLNRCVIFKGAIGLPNNELDYVTVSNSVFFGQTDYSMGVDNGGSCYNCILMPAATDDKGIEIAESIFAENNCFWSVAGSTLTRPMEVDGAEFYTRGNIEADPLFVDAANGDFRVQSGSPCVNAGIGLDGDVGFSSIGLDALTGSGGGSGRILVIHH